MTHWAVKMNRGRRTIHVHADYHVIEQGVLKFRNMARKLRWNEPKRDWQRGENCGYPVNVQAFAAGEWAVVTNMDLEVTER